MHEGVHEQTGEAGPDRFLEVAAFVALVVVALALNIYFRIPMLHFYGFYEPDGYFHYAVIRAAVANNFIVPRYLLLSGHPVHQPLSEPKGLYYMTVAPYYFLRFFGVSYYYIERHIALLFGILDAIGAYFLSRYLSKDKLFGALVMLFVGLSMGNAARTSAIIYRGDTFVAPFVILALILVIELFKQGSGRRKLLLTLLTAIALTGASFVWNGASFAIAIYVFAFMLLLLAGFVFEKKELVDNCKYLLGALLLWFVLVNVLIFSYLVTEQSFTGVYFFALFAVMLIAWYLSDTLLMHKQRLPGLLSTPANRLLVSLGFVVVAVAAIYFLIPSFVYQLFVANGFIANSAFATTIQELQSPSISFLTASFGVQNYMTPMGYFIIASTYSSGFKYLFWIVMLIFSAVYLFMHVERSGGFASGEARLKLELHPAMLILLSYFAITAYLEIHAIRFNSLLSIPLAVISAYTVYWAVLYGKKNRYVLFATGLVTAALFAYLANILYIFLQSPYAFAGSLLLVVGGSAAVAYLLSAPEKRRERLLYNFVTVLLLVSIVLYMALRDISYTGGLYPADSVNPQFISALAWMKNNTPSSSVVLTLWPDGSLVEGVANLTSVSDSVGKQNAAIANPFAAWLYSSSPDPQFLFGNASDRPDYLLTRSIWLNEGAGIYTESGLNVSPSTFGFLALSNVSEYTVNNTQVYNFSGSGVKVETIIRNINGTRSVGSFAVVGRSVSPFAYLAFSDQDNGNFSVIKQTSFGTTNNETFMISYSNVPAARAPVNITGAMVMSPGLAASNMAKFLYFCGVQSCLWDNNVAQLSLIYANSDTRIYKINYNATAPVG